MIDTDKYEGHTPAPWDSLVCATTGKKWIIDGPEETGQTIALVEGIGENDVGWINMWLMADAPLLLAEVKRLQSEPTVTVDDYHKEGHLYITVRFPDGEEYVGLVEKWEGDEE